MKRNNQLRFLALAFFMLISLQANAQFITTWRTTTASESIFIPTFSGETYDYTVDWGDGQSSMNQTGNATHVYATADTFTVTITGTFPRIYFNELGLNVLKILTIEQWGNNPWTSMENAFTGCFYLNSNATDAPDLSNVTSLSGAFKNTSRFNSDLSNWDVSNVQNMSFMFQYSSNFNGNITTWNTSNVTTMEEMFSEAASFNQPIGAWNTSNVTSMRNMLSATSSFNQNLGNWDVSQVSDFFLFKTPSGVWSETNIDKTFIAWSKQTLQTGQLIAVIGNYCQSTNAIQHITSTYGWNIIGLTQNCTGKDFITTWQTTTANESITIPTFSGETYNYNINWGDGSAVSSGQTGDATHTYATAGTYTVSITGEFPRIYFAGAGDKDKIQSVAQWGSVAWNSMSRAFEGCTNMTITATDGPNLSCATDLSQMFQGSGIATPNLSAWDVSTITNMSNMFGQASNFDANLDAWNMSNVTNANNMLDNTSLSLVNYDNLLVALASQSLKNAVNFGGINLEYCMGVNARQSLIDNFSWVITDAGRNCSNVNFFQTTWQTTTANESITIPTFSGSIYKYHLDWGDGTLSTNSTGDASHTYAVAGTYTVKITGAFPRIYFNNSGDAAKIQSVSQWGGIAWSSMASSFYGCSNLAITATDAPDLSNVSSTNLMFASSGITTPDLSSWNMSTITGMGGMFQSTANFNGDLSSWNTANAISMDSAFAGASSFNRDLNSWDVSKVTGMKKMFINASIFNGNISNWNTANVTDMTSMFGSAVNFNRDLNNWDVGKVESMQGMFLSAFIFNGNISNWNTSSVTNMLGMFAGASSFNGDLNSWDVSKVTNMRNMFISAVAFNGNITNWNTSSLVVTRSMFNNAPLFNQDISNWNVSRVTNMADMFKNATAFNQPIGQWNTSSLDVMAGLFLGATSFNQDLSNWNTSLVYNMIGVFSGATAFNQDIGNWNTAAAQSMNSMFKNATAFNQDISNWNTGVVRNMGSMFEGASSFNQDIGNWNTAALGTMDVMFQSATAFNQNLGNWNIGLLTSASSAFNASGLSGTNYDSLLVGWSSQTLQNSVNFGANTSSYCFASAARQSIIDNFSWVITDAGECNDSTLFKTTWQTTTANESITIPTFSGETYSYNVNWGDGTSDTGLTGNASHTYASAGTHTVSIAGTFPRIYFNLAGDRAKIRSIEQWGTIQWTSMANAFFGCTNLSYNATDVPDLSNVTDLSSMFRSCPAFNGNIGNWNTSTVTDMNRTFQAATTFNQAIGSWDVSNVQNMSSMFAFAPAFNQDISGWNTSNVQFMTFMFEQANAFNQPIGAWNTSSVTDMLNIFNETASFDQDLSNWDISQVSDLGRFNTTASWSTSNIDKTLIAWSKQSLQPNLSVLIDGSYCHSATARQHIIDTFNWIFTPSLSQNCTNQEFITTWQTTASNESITIPTFSGETYNYSVNWGDGLQDIGLTGNATHTYASAGAYTVIITGTFPRLYFNFGGDIAKVQSVAQWGTVDWASMSGAFGNGTSLTITATDAPDLSRVTDMGQMFQGCTSLNTSINHWNVSNVTRMTGLFSGATSFNQPLNNWDVSNVTYMNDMFRNCAAFNQDLNNWNTGKVTSMRKMFDAASVFNGNITNWNIVEVQDMEGMFASASRFNQDIGGWNISKSGNIRNIFENAVDFNQDISNWDVSNIGFMYGLFSGATSFNQDISNWDVSNVRDMRFMFQNATSFNQPIGKWNTGSVTDFGAFLSGASAFDQSLANFDMSSASILFLMLSNSGISTANYDQTLIGWAGQTLLSNRSFAAENVTYCAATNERQSIITNFAWSITDGGQACATTPTIWNGTAWDNGTPTASSIALIEGNYNSATNGSFATGELWVKPGNTLNIDGGFSISTTGNLYNYGTVSVANDNSFIQTASAPINDGNGAYEVKREGADYHGVYNYWSSPVRNTTISDVFGATGRKFYTFDSPTQAWQGASRTATLNAGRGFTATGTSNTPTTITRTFSDSTGFNSGDISQSLYYSGSFHADSNWHLVGNPYPSGLDVNQFITDNTALIENAVYLWSSDGSDYTSSNADYATMNSMGIVNAGGSGVAPSSATISSAQGFFVQSKASGNLTFSNSQRVATNNTFLRTTSDNAKIWLGVENQNGVSNELLIGFMADAEDGKDLYDASKFSGNGFVSLYSLANIQSRGVACNAPTGCDKLAIQGLPLLTNERAIPIGIEAKEAGEFTFSINHLDGLDESTEIYLHDSETNELVDMRAGNYKINLEKGEFNERFELRFVGGKVTDLPNVETAIRFTAFPNPFSNQISISTGNQKPFNWVIYGMDGKQFGSGTAKPNETIQLPELSSGVFLLQIEQEGDIQILKVLKE